VNAFGAELLKARTTRLLLWYAGGLAAFLVFVVSIHVATDDRFDLARLSTQRSLLAVSGLAAVVTALVGSILLAGEYNHGTINQSLLVVPDRLRFLLAKLEAVLVVGAAFAVLADVLVLVAGKLWYTGRGLTLHLGNGVAAPLLGTLAASALAAAIGLALAAILRRQTATLVIVLLWLLIGENIIGISSRAAPYAPGHVFGAIVAAHSNRTHDLLAVGPALIVAVVYVLVLGVFGALIVLGSDAPGTGE
jgi:ABC-2 type transport system permease protein